MKRNVAGKLLSWVVAMIRQPRRFVFLALAAWLIYLSSMPVLPVPPPDSTTAIEPVMPTPMADRRAATEMSAGADAEPPPILDPGANNSSNDAAAAAADTAAPPPSSPGIRIISSDAQRTQLQFSLPAHTISDIELGGRRFSQIHAAGAETVQRRGYPAVPCFRTKLAVAADADSHLQIVAATYEEIACAAPLPSSGFLPRQQRQLPGEVVPAPQFYDGSAAFPPDVAVLSETVMIRHIAGVSIVIYPFQYFPDRGKLRIYTHLELELVNQPATTTAEPLQLPPPFRNPDFAALGRSAFANYAQLESAALTRQSAESDDQPDAPESPLDMPSASRELPPDDAQHLLMLVPDAFLPTVAAFVQWKRERGLTVSVAAYPSDTGSGSVAVAAYIQQRYDQDQITYVIIVGDHTDIPVQRLSPHPSDTRYALVSGEDLFHDLFISRISASTADQIDNQLTKIINYERNPSVGAWLAQGLVVGSDEGHNKSAFQKKDWQILDVERQKLLDADIGYTVIARVYDPGASSAAVVDAWNAGCSLVYYLGHGTDVAWTTSGFSVSTLNASVRNNAQLPFVINANCHNGNFTRSGGDCFAEAMMNLGSSSTPGGAVGVIASTTAMAWDPPIVMLQSFSDLLVANTAPSAGALTFASIQEAMRYCQNTPSEGEAAAATIMEQTHLFGDCTLGLRTRPPLLLQVEHPPEIVGNREFVVQVTDINGTVLAAVTVCLYESGGSQIVARTDADGQARLLPGVLFAEQVRLTVYERNVLPYQVDLPVIGALPAIVSPATLPLAVVAEVYSFTYQAIGGEPPYLWSLEPTTAPQWLAIDAATGTLSGTAPAAATYTFTVRVEDAAASFAEQSVTLTAGTAVQLPTADLPRGMVGVAYDAVITAAGSFTPFRFALQAGALPPGLSLSESGALHGTAAVAGEYLFSVEVTDALGRVAAATFALVVEPEPNLTITTAPTLPPGKRTEPYEQVFAASGGSGSGFFWQLHSGALPPGLHLASSGRLSGSAQQEGQYSFTLIVRDDWQPAHTATRQFNLQVNADVYFTTVTLPDAALATAYSATIGVAGSYPPFTLTDTLAGTGFVVSETANSFSLTGERQITWVGDEQQWHLDLGFAFPFYGSKYTSCQVGDKGYLLFAGAAPNPKWDASASQLAGRVMIAPFWNDILIRADDPETGVFVSSSAGAVTIRWRGRGFREPHDLVNFAVTLEATGRIRFTYGALATANRVVVGLGAGTADSQQVLFTHSWNSLQPQPVEGWANRSDLVLMPPNTLPPWLSLSSTGELSGTATAAGTYTFEVRASDANGNKALRQFAINVIVDNAAILAYAETLAAGIVDVAAFEEAVEQWRANGDAGSTRTLRNDPVAAAMPPPVARIGEIFVLDLAVAAPQHELAELLHAGYDAMPGAQAGQITVYATPAELQALLDAGYALQIIGRQFVGDPQLDPLAAEPDDQRGPPAGYRNYAALSTQLQSWADSYPQLANLVSLGQSVHKRQLWAMQLTADVNAVADKPQVRIIASMHGDEPLGTELCLNLIEMLLTGYVAADNRIRQLLDNSEVWIVPCLNPDGYEAGTRYNANGLDLNRMFPDGVQNNLGTVYVQGLPEISGLQPEVAAVMHWSASQAFALAANLHSGALVVCYPYGNNAEAVARHTPTPDDALLQSLALAYSANNPDMWQNSPFPQGIINGAAWYPVSGEMADWHYRYCATPELTVELSVNKKPGASTLPGHWQNNQQSLLRFLEAAQSGCRGIVSDALTAAPLYSEVTVVGNSQPVFSDPGIGRYTRLLLPGSYTLDFRCPGYFNQRITDVVVASGPATRLDVLMLPSAHVAERSFRWPNAAVPQRLRVTLNLAFDPAAAPLPNAVIVSESMPDAWQYVADSTQSAAGEPLPEPRRHGGNQLSWLFWATAVADQSFSYELQLQQAATALPSFFDGNLEMVAGTTPIIGRQIWNDQYTQTLSLSSGWNLMSLPLAPLMPQLQQLFPALSGAFAWKWNGQNYEPTSVLEPKQGYWLYAATAQSSVYTGMPVATPQHTFNQGWNLFGPLVPLATQQISGSFRSDNVFGWSGSSYAPVADLLPRQGYWLDAVNSQRVDLNTGEIAKIGQGK